MHYNYESLRLDGKIPIIPIKTRFLLIILCTQIDEQLKINYNRKIDCKSIRHSNRFGQETKHCLTEFLST